MVQIYSYLNNLTASEEKDKYCFRSVVDQTLDSEQLIKEIINYNSTITEADARAVLSVLNTKVKYFVNLGYKVELPFGYIYNKANGTVARVNDGFVPGTGNHRISTVFRFKDDAAYEMTKNASYKNAGSGYVILPQITELYSIKNNGKEDESLSFAAGSILRIMGKNISFNIEDALQGVFLIDGEHHETRIESYNRIGTNVVEAYIPAVSAGSYEVKIVTKPGTDRYEKCVASKKIEVTA
ncbi:MAG: DUF4469 domain-containing protein [Clostridia bacterium]|nr:DUF4469 domain-containing protein [Clostridia bacterium]